jgi:hypothetical protein
MMGNQQIDKHGTVRLSCLRLDDLAEFYIGRYGTIYKGFIVN